MGILDIFYNQVVVEATKGRIDCYFMFNVLFESSIPSLNIRTVSTYDNDSLLIPVLRVDNKEEFDNLLIEYVNIAMNFYSDFLQNIPDEEKRIKTVMSLIWSNATLEDFNNPIDFLKRRISFFNGESLNSCSFYSNVLNSDVSVNIKKSVIESETPYCMSIKLSDAEEEFCLPNVYFGIDENNVAYIYAIQNDRRVVNEGKYAKKMNRFLYKINDGLDVLEDTFENYGVGNLKDVSSSFVLASNIAMGYLNKVGVKEIVIPSILITRWNAKEISNDVKRKMGKNDFVLSDEEHSRLQSNLTEKFLRTFRRLDYHHSGINITSYPFDVDSNMYIKITEQNYCNNKILEDTYFGFDNIQSLRK